jgi:polyisoprenoid-binding protein YceI
MKKVIIILFVAIVASTNISVGQTIFLATGGNVSFFSETKAENIEATTSSMTSVLNISTGEIAFTVPMRTFKFKKSLMEEHFNEKYVESEKYPKSVFKAKVNEKIDWTKDGVYNVTATGNFDLHGVTKEVTEKGKVTIKDGKILLECNFQVSLKDYKIEVPSIVSSVIADLMDVKMSCTYQPYKKAQ